MLEVAVMAVAGLAAVVKEAAGPAPVEVEESLGIAAECADWQTERGVDQLAAVAKGAVVRVVVEQVRVE